MQIQPEVGVSHVYRDYLALQILLTFLSASNLLCLSQGHPRIKTLVSVYVAAHKSYWIPGVSSLELIAELERSRPKAGAAIFFYQFTNDLPLDSH